MSDKWKHDNWHVKQNKPDQHCPFCEIESLRKRLEALSKKWRKAAKFARRTGLIEGRLDVEDCADELEAALSPSSD